MPTKKPAGKRKAVARGKSQRDKFIDAARKLGCDDNADRFNAVVKKLAEQPPQPRKPKKVKK